MKKQGDFVTAYKGSLTKRFTRRSWNAMGTDKYGWLLVPEAPKEVAGLHKKEASPEPPKVEAAPATIPGVETVTPKPQNPDKALADTKKIVEKATPTKH